MRKVIAAEANNDFSLNLKFADGTCKRFDVKPYLAYPEFQELGNLVYFKQIRLAYGTVQWRGEQDISPETLYLERIDI